MADISNMTDISGSQVAAVKTSMPEPSPARTELGRKLREIRKRIVASGQTLLDKDGLDQEIQDRSGAHLGE